MQMPASLKHTEILCLRPPRIHSLKYAEYQTQSLFQNFFVFPTWVNSHVKQSQLANMTLILPSWKGLFWSDFFLSENTYKWIDFIHSWCYPTIYLFLHFSIQKKGWTVKGWDNSPSRSTFWRKNTSKQILLLVERVYGAVDFTAAKMILFIFFPYRLLPKQGEKWVLTELIKRDEASGLKAPRYCNYYKLEPQIQLLEGSPGSCKGQIDYNK